MEVGFGFLVGRPSNTTTPRSAGTYPVIMLNTVVLPDPLGPISAVTVPAWISNEQRSTAVIPPNRLLRPSRRKSAVTTPPVAPGPPQSTGAKTGRAVVRRRRAGRG